MHSGSHSTGLIPPLLLNELLHKQYKNSLSSSEEPFQAAMLEQRAMGRGRGKSFCLFHIYLSSSVGFFLTSLGVEKGEMVARTRKSSYE